jgi:hypothetical protein
MGEWAHARRHVIVAAFEAGSGDMDGATEPITIFRRDPSTVPVLQLRQVHDGDVLRVSYTIIGGPFDTADIERLYAIAYLDELALHYYQGKAKTIAFTNAATGAEHRLRYPDPE